jgi:hypothetical protein
MLIAAALGGLILVCTAASVLTASLARIAARADDVRPGAADRTSQEGARFTASAEREPDVLPLSIAAARRGGSASPPPGTAATLGHRVTQT